MNQTLSKEVLVSREEAPAPMPAKTDNAILPPALSELPEMLNSSQLAILFGCSPNTIRSMLRENKIRSIRIGQQYRAPKVWILEDFFAGGGGSK